MRAHKISADVRINVKVVVIDSLCSDYEKEDKNAKQTLQLTTFNIKNAILSS